MNIYYFKPYDTRGVGYAYNRHCELVPELDDWICLFDTDTMVFSSQRLQSLLESVIIKFYPQFAAFTCVTNRAFQESQQQLQMGIRETRDLVVLKARADWQMAHRADRVEELRTGINGHLMLFPKRLWLQIPFPTAGLLRRGKINHVLGVDSEWHRQLREAGLKVGLIHQLMVTHFYRLDDAEESVRHIPGGQEWWYGEGRQ